MSSKRNRESSGGLSLRVLNNLIILGAVVISVSLLFNLYETLTNYWHLQEVTQRCIDCQQDEKLFLDGTDYLTEECRAYAMTGNIAHVNNYIEELQSTRRREHGVESVRGYLEAADTYTLMRKALAISNVLSGEECYAMRLAAELWGTDLKQLPDRVRGLGLTVTDSRLDREALRLRVAELLFGEHYMAQKREIRSCVSNSLDALIQNTQGEQLTSGARLGALLRRQRVRVMLLLLLTALVSLGTSLLIIRPLEQSVKRIRRDEELQVNGAHEMRVLARAYNDMYAQHNSHTKQLTYNATHDALTGLYNRAGYEALCADLDEGSAGVLMIDVDEFKNFNDVYGHDMGDLVLRRVAEALRANFRADDALVRLGGDEFCVIMARTDSSLRRLVGDKVARIRGELRSGAGDVPSVTLSVGVAFGDRPNPTGDIFKDADTALYTAKRRGRDYCVFYGEEQESGIRE